MEYLRRVIGRLAGRIGIQVVSISPIYETEPVGVPDQPPFLNLVAQIETALSPEELFVQCRDLEKELERVERARWGPRTIDIDLLHYEGISCETCELILPHPRLLERRFVLQPLADIAPDLVIDGQTVRKHLMNLSDSHAVHPTEERISLASI